MGKKDKKKGGGGGGGGAKKEEEPLQAVLLADSFEETFRPITLDRPKALLPIGNVPLIEYSLEFLAEGGVKEIFVFCSHLSDQIEEYLNNSRWKNNVDPVIRVLKFKNASNACHAIRELDSLDVLRSDPFILLTCDLVSNVKLKPILEGYKKRRKEDKNNIMTMVFSKIDHRVNRIQSMGEELLLAIDGNSKQLLKYENALDQSSTQIRGDFFEEHPMIELRYDLLDTFIDICSSEMVVQIADNFDYQDLRKDFIKNEVQNLELGYRVHAHELTSPSDYAARVRCLRTYNNITKDIIRRWLYPLVPDSNWSSELTMYSSERGFRYRDNNVKISRSSFIGENTMIGANCEIGPNAKIINSILGPNCVIEDGAVIENSYLWRDVLVKRNGSVRSSVLCDGVIIHEGAKVSRGCVLSFGVQIGPKVVTSPFARITISKKQEKSANAMGMGGGSDSEDFGDFTDDEDESTTNEKQQQEQQADDEEDLMKRRTSSTMTDKPVDPAVVGEGGFGIRYSIGGGVTGGKASPSVRHIPKWAQSTYQQMRKTNPSLQFRELVGGIESTELEHARSLVWHNKIDFDDAAEDEDDMVESPDQRFLRGVSELVGITPEDPEDIEHENILLELNGFKFAENRSFEDILFAVIPAIVSPVVVKNDDGDLLKNRVVKESKAVLQAWKPTLSKLLLGIPQQVALLNAMEILFICGDVLQSGMSGLTLQHSQILEKPLPVNEKLAPAREAFPHILLFLVSQDLVLPQAVEIWSSSHSTTGMNDTIIGSKNVSMVIEQLTQESSSEEDDDDEEEEEDDDEDEDDGDE